MDVSFVGEFVTAPDAGIYFGIIVGKVGRGQSIPAETPTKDALYINELFTLRSGVIIIYPGALVGFGGGGANSGALNCITVPIRNLEGLPLLLEGFSSSNLSIIVVSFSKRG